MKYKNNNNVMLRSIAGEHMLIPVKSLGVNDGSLMMLNDTGAFIWNLLDTSLSMNDILGLVYEQFEGDHAIIREEVIAFLDDLLDKRLIIRED